MDFNIFIILFFIFNANFINWNPILNDSPWFKSIGFLFLSMGIYEKLTYLRLWWELRSFPPDLLKKIKLDYEQYGINFDPVAHKLGLLEPDELNLK